MSDLKAIITTMQLPIDSSFDPICVVNEKNQIVYANLAMKSFLQLRKRDVDQHPVFCDLVKLSVCLKGCCVEEVLKTGNDYRIDQTPAAKGAEKFRVLFKVTPIRAGSGPDSAGSLPILGAIVSLRDTTGEILLQAKYHKMLQILGERDLKINALNERVEALRLALRRIREDSAA